MSETGIRSVKKPGRTAVPAAVLLAAVLLASAMLVSACSASDAAVKKGTAAYEDSDYSLALAEFDKAASQKESDPAILNKRGMAAFGLGRYGDAAADFEAAASLAEASDKKEVQKNAAAYYANLGDCESRMGQSDQAMEDYTKALQLDPSLSVVYNKRGNLYFEQEQYGQAADDFSSAIDLEETSGDDQALLSLYWNRAEAYRLNGDQQEAVNDYLIYGQMAGDNLDNDYYAKLASLYCGLSQFDQAKENYQKAIQLAPDDPNLYLGLAQISLSQEDYSSALDQLSQYISQTENDSGADQKALAAAYGDRGLCDQQQGDTEKALADYSKAVELDPDYAWAYFMRGKLYQQMEDYENAAADYQKAQDLGGTDADQ